MYKKLNMGHMSKECRDQVAVKNKAEQSHLSNEKMVKFSSNCNRNLSEGLRKWVILLNLYYKKTIYWAI